MNAIKFSEKITIAAEPAVVFDFTQDYTKRLAWDTFLRKAVLVEGATSAALGRTRLSRIGSHIGRTISPILPIRKTAA